MAAIVLLATCLARVVFAAEEGLVAHYPFDEGTGSVVRDAGPHGLDGIIHGATYQALDQGFALEFDGVDDHVEIPDSEHLRLATSITVSAWLNTPAESGQNVLAKNGCSTLRQNYRLSISRSAASFTVVNCPEHGRTATGSGVEANSWFHLVGTFAAGKTRVYINGELRGELVDEPFDTGTLEAPLYIGGSFYGAALNGPFTGQIDDVRVYDRVLSEQEIRASYESEKDLRISTLDRLLAQISPTEKRDTTPPALHSPRPAPDLNVDEVSTISGRFEEEGSGIDIASTRIFLDNDNITEHAQIDERGFSLSALDLADGIHQVAVEVADKAGNIGNRLQWRFGVNQPLTTRSEFDGDVFRVDGEPWFPVGIYSSNVSPSFHMPYLAQAAAAGINYKLIGERGVIESLDDLQQFGMKGLVHVYYASLALGRGDREPLATLVKTARSHPGNLGWWNEYSSVNQSSLATETYEFIRQRDPDHPVIYMLAWAGALSDAYFVYAYPIENPLLPDNSITSIDELILKPAFQAARAEDRGKQVWFTSQAFDYRLDSNRGKVVTLEGGFRPSREEVRSMNYFALTKGVKGLCFYAPGGEIPGTKYVDDVALYPRQWTEILKVASEVRYLAPTLAAGAVVETVKLIQDGTAVHFIERLHEGVHTLIAVNVEPELVLVEWEFDGPVQLEVLFEDRAPANAVKSFTDLFNPLEVHVYQWPER